MNATTTNGKTATPETATPKQHGWGRLPCPRCGEEASVRVYLEDLLCECTECDATWTPEDLRPLLAKWAPVLAWLDQAPALPE